MSLRPCKGRERTKEPLNSAGLRWARLAHPFSVFLVLRSFASSKPFDKLLNTLFDLCLWIITKQAPRFRDIGKRLRHITGLQRLAIDISFCSQLSFQQ